MPDGRRQLGIETGTKNLSRQRTLSAKKLHDLADFLVTNNLSHYGWSLRLEEGEAFGAISRAVDEIRPDLLIMGTRGRSGLLKILIGSVTEEALRSLNVDILAVPPVSRTAG